MTNVETYAAEVKVERKEEARKMMEGIEEREQKEKRQKRKEESESKAKSDVSG